MRSKAGAALAIFTLLLITDPLAQEGAPPHAVIPDGDIAHALGLPARDAALAQSTGALASVTTPGMSLNMTSSSPFSTAVMTTLGGTGVNLLGDWDGREDYLAEHAGLVAENLTPNTILTRTAISEHTIANGYAENILYYGDSSGNVYVASSTVLTTQPPTPNVLTINLPTVLNAFGTLTSASRIAVTGLAVNPVADLTSFANVNGSFAPFAGQIGEILYVTFWDAGGGVRLASNGQIVRSGLLAFPIGDFVSPATAAPGVITPAGFPVAVGGSFGVAFSVFANVAGVAVDDDGSVYFQQVDLIDFQGGNIVKITDTGTNQDRSLAVNPFPTFTSLTSGLPTTATGPAAQQNTFTNFSGTALTWGNLTALAAGPGNILYAALARSFNVADDAATQATEGLFANPFTLGPTPSMIVSFADCAGAVANCALTIPTGNGVADVAAPGLSLTAGVNNFRVFVLGDGPERRSNFNVDSPVFGNLGDTQKLQMSIDFSIYSGLAVDEENTVYVVSGGTPAGAGRNPSPTLGEILAFPDTSYDRRADYIDLRSSLVPIPPVSSQFGDFQSNRFDHIFWAAPVDPLTVAPDAIAGLSRGFLLYLNRTRPGTLPSLPNGVPQGDDSTSGLILFDSLDPGHQVAGGDDQRFPFQGDDSDGGGNPADPTFQAGGFEFNFQNGPGGGPSVWNGFFLNSNGNVTFGTGDTDNTPTAAEFATGAPKIAAAWSDLDPAARGNGFLGTFPVQALGFAGVNHFKVRWINVPEFGKEDCGSSNSLSISLYDDGTGIDENANQPLNPANPIGNNAVPFDLQEGPTAGRFALDPNLGIFNGTPARPDGSGQFQFSYGRMDLVGTAARPVLVGYSVGGQPVGGPFQDIRNLSLTTLDQQIGAGYENAIYELFNTGSDGPAAQSFDLRAEGNSAAFCTPPTQGELNRGIVRFFGKPAGAVTLPLPLIPRKLGDFDGDKRTDFGAYRPSTSTWFLLTISPPSAQAIQFGFLSDVPVQADFDGDGKTDIALWRPSTGTWTVIRSSNGSTITQQWGQAGDIPIPADFDGDGKADFAIWRPGTGTWWIVPSAGGPAYIVSWGSPGDIPLAGDYDGDKKADVVVWRPSTGQFIVGTSSTPGFVVAFGTNGDIPIAGDFDGDGKTDLAVFRPNTNTWYTIQSSTNNFVGVVWGSFGDLPVIGDFDGDGRTDVAVWRPSNGTWYVSTSTGGVIVQPWGQLGDRPF